MKSISQNCFISTENKLTWRETASDDCSASRLSGTNSAWGRLRRRLWLGCCFARSPSSVTIKTEEINYFGFSCTHGLASHAWLQCTVPQEPPGSPWHINYWNEPGWHSMYKSRNFTILVLIKLRMYRCGGKMLNHQ